MMKVTGFIRLITFSAVLLGFANGQQKDLRVVKDTLISQLQDYRAVYAINPAPNQKISLGPKVVDKSTATRVRARGFRVQIYSGSSRSEATEVQNAFLRQNPDVGAYLDYVEPNYRVKVGDFTTRAEASQYMRRLRQKYRNVFVFVEDIWVWK